MKKIKILDYFVHQANQYEFSKLNHEYYLVAPNSQKPDWDENDRPLRKNIHLITEHEALRKIFDIIIIRSPIHMDRYKPFIKRGSIPIGTIQTTSPYPMHKDVQNIVWNSYDAMKKHQSYYPKRHHHYVVHGFDPNEFQNLNFERNNRILTVANVFKQRDKIMGYDLWNEVNKIIGNCDLVGHGNDDIPESLGKAKNFQELLNYYNSYQIFFNPTKESAMPRSRGEALMVGMATVTTSKFDIAQYYSHKKNILFANTVSEVLENIKLLNNNSKMVEDLGNKARETAMKHFHISDYISKWDNILKKA